KSWDLPRCCLTSGQRLEHGNLVTAPDPVGKGYPVLRRLAIDVDRDMAAQPALVIENVSAQERPVHAGLRQRLAQVDGLDLDLRRRHMTLQMGCEIDAGH